MVLNHTGMSYSTLADIAKQASADLGFKVEMQVVDHPGLTNRMVNRLGLIHPYELAEEEGATGVADQEHRAEDADDRPPARFVGLVGDEGGQPRIEKAVSGAADQPEDAGEIGDVAFRV